MAINDIYTLIENSKYKFVSINESLVFDPDYIQDISISLNRDFQIDYNGLFTKTLAVLFNNKLYISDNGLMYLNSGDKVAEYIYKIVDCNLISDPNNQYSNSRYQIIEVLKEGTINVVDGIEGTIITQDKQRVIDAI